MRVERLQLASFRSYAQLDVSFPSGPQVVVGPNATGKTNLLESLVVLGTPRSHRPTQDGELIACTDEFARLEASTGADNQVEVFSTRSATGGERRRCLINGVARRPTALAQAL